MSHTTHSAPREPGRRLWLACLYAALALGGGVAQGQTIYRIVGPDGKISFSDKPPAQGSQAKALSANGRDSDPSGGADMPYEVRQAMSQYPVTLYTGDGCEPCTAARNLLTSRGVPFTERTLTTADDLQALKQLGMEATVPLATVGSQRLKGYSESEWNSYLDAAGYPRTSRLPSTYHNPPASPLAPAAAKPAPVAAGSASDVPAPPPPPPPAPAPAGPTPDNPAGIVF